MGNKNKNDVLIKITESRVSEIWHRVFYNGRNEPLGR